MEENVAVICPICKCSGRENWVSITCGHVFHAQCVIQWNERNQSCPICRQKMGPQTTLFMNFEEVSSNSNSIQDLELVINQRKEIKSLKSKAEQLQNEVGSKDLIIGQKCLQISEQSNQINEINNQMQSAARESNIWRTRFEQEQKCNSLKKLFDDITDREIDNILKQLQAGQCYEFIRKEKRKSQEQYKQLMKKYEEAQKQNQKLEMNLLKITKKQQQQLQEIQEIKLKQDSEQNQVNDLFNLNNYQSKLQKLWLGSKKRILQQTDNDVVEVKRVKQNQQSDLLRENQNENQYKGDEDFVRFGQKRGQFQSSNVQENQKLKPNFSFAKDSKKEQQSLSSFYCQRKKEKRSFQESIESFLKPS